MCIDRAWLDLPCCRCTPGVAILWDSMDVGRATSPISLHTFADALNEAVAVGPELVAMRQFSEADIQCMRPPNQMPKAWLLVTRCGVA
eukprot:s1100_g7.t2